MGPEAHQAYLDARVEACKEYRRVRDALSRAYASRTTPRSSEPGDEVFEVGASPFSMLGPYLRALLYS